MEVYLLPLVVTIIIELFVLYLLGFKEKKLYAAVALINLVTNPILNLTLFHTKNLLFIFGWIYIFFLEAIVIICEYIMLKLIFRDLKLPFLKLSFVLNASSFLIGLIIL